MTKLRDDAELALRRLDDEDDAEPDCTERQPYRRLAAWVVAETNDRAGIQCLAMAGLGPERLAPAKRNRGERLHKPDALAFAVDDVSRLKSTVPDATAELVAVERCRRSAPHDDAPLLLRRTLRLHAGMWQWGQRCTVDKYGDLDDGWAVELDELVEKLHKRLHR